jgi:hypothetical protein
MTLCVTENVLLRVERLRRCEDEQRTAASCGRQFRREKQAARRGNHRRHGRMPSPPEPTPRDPGRAISLLGQTLKREPERQREIVDVRIAALGSMVSSLEKASEAESVQLCAEADIPPEPRRCIAAGRTRTLAAVRAQPRDEVR